MLRGSPKPIAGTLTVRIILIHKKTDSVAFPTTEFVKHAIAASKWTANVVAHLERIPRSEFNNSQSDLIV